MTSVNIRVSKGPSNVRLQLANSAQVNTSDLSNLFKQVIKGSKSSEILGQTQKSFAATESHIENSYYTFQRLSALVTHLSYQQEEIDKHIHNTTVVIEQLNAIQKQSALN